MFNYENIGGKIKTVVELFTRLAILLVFIAGVWFAFVTGKVVLCLLSAALISLFLWISSFFMYGFGQLVENSDILVMQQDILLTSQNEETDNI